MRPLSEIEMFNGLFGLESVWTILSLVWGTSQELSGVAHVWRFLNPPCFISVWCFGWANGLTNIRQVWCCFSEFLYRVQTAVGLFGRLLDEQLQHCHSRFCFCRKCTVQKFCCQITLICLIRWKISNKTQHVFKLLFQMLLKQMLTCHKCHKLFVSFFMPFGNFYPTF